MKKHFGSKAELDAFVSAGMADGTLVGKALHAVVLHDNECTPTICVCEPEYILEDLTVENFTEGQKAQDDWVKKSTS